MRIFNQILMYCCMAVFAGCLRDGHMVKNLRTEYLQGRALNCHKWKLECDGLNDGLAIVSVEKAVSQLERSSDAVLLSVDSMVSYEQYHEVVTCLYTNYIDHAVDLGDGVFAKIYPFSELGLEGYYRLIKIRTQYFVEWDKHFARYPEELLGPIYAEMPGEESGFTKWFADLKNREPCAERIPESPRNEHTCFQLFTRANVRFGDVKVIFRDACEKGYEVLCWCCIDWFTP